MRILQMLLLAALAAGSELLKPVLGKLFKEGLQKQRLQALEEGGESITIMAVGEAGTGKTTLFRNLFQLDGLGQEAPPLAQTLQITEQIVRFDLEGVSFTAKLIDCPGYGETLNLERSFATATRYLDRSFRHLLTREMRKKRPAGWAEETHEIVDVVLYFFTPHRCKGVDLQFLRRLHGRASIVPILAKADTMTSAELAAFREEVKQKLESAKLTLAHPPLALICSTSFEDPTPLGRRYPWGMACSEAEGPDDHSELPQLRRFLLIEGLLSLKHESRGYYEAYRRRVMQQRSGLRSLLPPLPLLLASLLLPAARQRAVRSLGEGWRVVLAALASLQAKVREEIEPPPPPPGRPPMRLLPWG